MTTSFVAPRAEILPHKIIPHPHTVFVLSSCEQHDSQPNKRFFHQLHQGITSFHRKASKNPNNLQSSLPSIQPIPSSSYGSWKSDRLPSSSSSNPNLGLESEFVGLFLWTLARCAFQQAVEQYIYQSGCRVKENVLHDQKFLASVLAFLQFFWVSGCSDSYHLQILTFPFCWKWHGATILPKLPCA